MRKLIISEWVSLDGVFDADPIYFDKWWLPFDSPGRQKYIRDTINNCEIMLYGRTTYEMLYPYWSSFHHDEQGVADKLNKGKKYVVAVESKSLKARILDLLQRASARTRNSHDHSPISNVNH